MSGLSLTTLIEPKIDPFDMEFYNDDLGLMIDYVCATLDDIRPFHLVLFQKHSRKETDRGHRMKLFSMRKIEAQCHRAKRQNSQDINADFCC